jgi:hypothetical protein
MAWYSIDTEPVRGGGLTITPRSRVLSLRWRQAAFVWQTPTSVLIEGSGISQRVRVLDLTRIAQVALLLLAVLIGRIR